MKNLILLNNDTNIKLGDTGTLMQFKADDNNAPVSLIKGQSATFRIKNEFGFLKSIDADTTMNGYVFQFDTSALDGLVPGTYQLELAVTKSDNDVDIFPDTGFVKFTINENALSITGEQLPVMSLDDFKKQAQTYVNTQINGAETSLESNFQKYVDGIQSNTIDKANKASQDATSAVNTANDANSKAQQAVNTANGISQKITNNTNSITTLNNTLNTLLNSNDLTAMANNKTVANFNQLLTTGVYTFNAWVDSVQKLGNVPFTNCWGSVVVFPFGSPGSGNVVQVAVNDKGSVLYRTGLNSNFSNWQKLGGGNGLGCRNLLLDTVNHQSNNWIADYNNNHADNGMYKGSRIYKSKKSMGWTAIYS